MKVRDYVKVNETNGDIGLEIEVEGINFPMYSVEDKTGLSRQWTVTTDGSLRGDPECCEYVLRRPIQVHEIDRCIEKVQEAMDASNTRISPSVRAGVHVHINCQELEMTQLFTYATCYYILEELLSTFCEESRRGNHFCLRVSDAEYNMYMVQTAISSSNLRNLGSDSMRYSAVNWGALFKFGSLEFRSLETPEDLSKIGTWAKMLFRIKQMSLEYTNPAEVVQNMSENGAMEFASNMLGEDLKHFTTEPVETLVYQGVRNAQMMAFATNWDEFLKG